MSADFLCSVFIFSPSNLSSMNGTKPYPATWSKVSVIWKCMYETWGIPSPYKSRAQNTPFVRLRNLMATLTAYIFAMKHDRQSVKCVDNYKGSPTLSQKWTLVHKRLKTRPAFYPPPVNSAFCFIARLRRRTSANGTQPKLPSNGQ